MIASGLVRQLMAKIDDVLKKLRRVCLAFSDTVETILSVALALLRRVSSLGATSRFKNARPGGSITATSPRRATVKGCSLICHYPADRPTKSETGRIRQGKERWEVMAESLAKDWERPEKKEALQGRMAKLSVGHDE